MAETINEIIARTPTGGIAALPAGEYEGPVYVDRAMHIKGCNSTVWAKHGSVIEISAPGVTIEGLRVEITEGALSETAISAQYPTEIRNVEVLGAVDGFGDEDGEAEIPRTLALGELSFNEENTFTMTVDIPAAAVIKCEYPGIRFVPEQLPAGRSEVSISVTGSGSPALVYAEILLCSRVSRRIYLSGRFSADTPAVVGKQLYAAQPVDRSRTQKQTAPVTAVRSTSTDVITNVGSMPLPDGPVLQLKRGQRVPAAPYIGGKCSVYLTGQKLGNLDIDPYVFLLDENERAVGDGGLVFFGNEQSPDGAVRYNKDDGSVSIDLSMLSQRVKRVSVVYSVYSGSAQKNFSLIRSPMLSLFAQDKERVQFSIDGLKDEVTLVAAEFYIYKGEWRISAVGGGYRDGLVKLCNRYGIEVCG